MSAVRLYSTKGELLCKPFDVNSDEDCVIEENKVDLPIPDDIE